MKILFFTDNFPPESNAPAIRTLEHTREWVKGGHEVTVITCVPNFPLGKIYEGYSNSFYQRENVEGVSVVRVWSYITANEGSTKRILDYVSFMVSSILAAIFLPRPDVVIGTSPQFFAAVAAWVTAKIKRRPFVFELRDLWPESILAVGAMKKSWLMSQLGRLVSFLYRQADLMVPVTNAFAKVLENEGVPPERIVVVTNGIEPGSYTPATSPAATRERWGIPADAFVAGYIGTLGMAHGVSTVLEAAEQARDDATLHFVIMGSGADKAEIRTKAESSELHNLTIIDGQPRQDALDVLNSLDVSLVLLRNTPLFDAVIPSKIFEAMELGKPILLGVRGESRGIVVEQTQSGLELTPEDSAELVDKVRQLQSDDVLCKQLGDNGRAAVETKFRRSELARRMLTAIETCVRADT
jgi:glycosyltransferase involved in cell wall biosynthesis